MSFCGTTNGSSFDQRWTLMIFHKSKFTIGCANISRQTSPSKRKEQKGAFKGIVKIKYWLFHSTLFPATIIIKENLCDWKSLKVSKNFHRKTILFNRVKDASPAVGRRLKCCSCLRDFKNKLVWTFWPAASFHLSLILWRREDLNLFQVFCRNVFKKHCRYPFENPSFIFNV